MSKEMHRKHRLLLRDRREKEVKEKNRKGIEKKGRGIRGTGRAGG